MRHKTLTAAENLRRLLDGQEPEWTPFTLDVGAIQGMTDPMLRQFREKTGAPDPAEYFGYDYRLYSVGAKFGGDQPEKLHQKVEPGTTFDEWGIGHWAGGSEGTYEQMYPPLVDAQSVADVERLPWPRIDSQPDVAKVEAFHRAGYLVFGYGGSIYEWSWWLRGMEGFLMDLAAEPVLAEAVIRKVTAHTLALSLASAGAGVDVLCYYDDAGMQTGMQVDPRLWRQFIKPAWAQVLGGVRAAYPQTRFFLHSCGNITDIVPDIVDLGFDVLHPLQPECMSLETARKLVGDRIALCATVSAQKTLPFGSADQVRQEVRARRALAGRRCLVCPSNRIQPETPWENVVALVEAGREG